MQVNTLRQAVGPGSSRERLLTTFFRGLALVLVPVASNVPAVRCGQAGGRPCTGLIVPVGPHRRKGGGGTHPATHDHVHVCARTNT